MNSEKVKEIKKALELNEYYAIEYFPKSGEPKIFTFTDLLTLINELESENKELKKYKLDWLNNEKMHLQADMEDTEFELFCANKSLDEFRAENKKLKDRIAKLEHKCDDCAGCTQWKCDCANIKAYELEKFAERLKEKGKSTYDFFQCPTKENKVISFDDVDETLKEFINEKPTK